MQGDGGFKIAGVVVVGQFAHDEIKLGVAGQELAQGGVALGLEVENHGDGEVEHVEGFDTAPL